MSHSTECIIMMAAPKIMRTQMTNRRFKFLSGLCIALPLAWFYYDKPMCKPDDRLVKKSWNFCANFVQAASNFRLLKQIALNAEMHAGAIVTGLFQNRESAIYPA